MFIRPSELEIPKDDPFRDDALKRKELEPPLTQFVTQTEGPFVLALDGAWGAGKTTFLKMWQVKLKEAGHKCLYLNAWKTDFAQDPLVAVVGELSSAIKNDLPNEFEQTIADQTEKFKKIASSIAKRSIPLVVKLATSGLVDLPSLDMERAISNCASDIAEDRIKEYEDGKSDVEEFRKTLTELVAELTDSSSNELAKVIVLVDELDRCRPTYAVQLLERIKHLFDVPGVIFVLGIDRSQLNHSIRVLYGSDFNSFEYLRRFIDLDYRLPEPKPECYSDHLCNIFKIHDLISMRPDKNDQNRYKKLKEILGSLMSAAKMNLRTQEQIISRLRIILQSLSREESLYETELAILLFLREWDYFTYEALFQKTVDTQNLFKQINNLPNIKALPFDFTNTAVETYLLVANIELGFGGPHLNYYKEMARSSQTESSRFQRILDQVKQLHPHAFVDGVTGTGASGFRITEERIALTNNFILNNESAS